jgi:hypothetical protein
MNLRPHLLVTTAATLFPIFLHAAADSALDSFDRRSSSAFRPAPIQPQTIVVPNITRTTKVVDDATGADVGVAPEATPEIAAQPRNQRFLLQMKTLKVVPPGEVTRGIKPRKVRKIVVEEVSKNPVTIFNPWNYAASSTSTLTYDTNAPTSLNAEGAWIFGEEIDVGAQYKPTEKSPWTFSAGGAYAVSRYSRFSENDFDFFAVNAGAEYVVSKCVTVSLSNSVTWGYTRGLNESIFARDRLAGAIEYKMDEHWKIAGIVKRDWFDNQSDSRVIFVGAAGWTLSTKRKAEGAEPEQTSGYWNFGATMSVEYAVYDSDREYLRVIPSLEIAYQICKNVSAKLKIGYTDSQDSIATKDFEQFTFAPNIIIEAKW